MPNEIQPQSENRSIYHELIMTQLKQHDEGILRLETKLDARMDDIREKIQQVMTAQQVSQATLGDRLTRLEARMDNIDSRKQDYRWLIGIVIALISVAYSIFSKH